MTAHASYSAFSGARRALLIGSAIGGLCAAAGQVDAQAFNANPKTVAGAVTYDRATPGVETVTIDSASAIINWTPPSIPAIFLPTGNTATFVNGPSVADYAVLNRIQSVEPIRFDGHVLGLIGDLAAGTAAPGGTIVFSSPGGIIIGSTAIFDVGNLVLTSLNVVDDGTGNFYDPASQGLLFAPFGGAPQGAGVMTEQDARINALGQGSFVAIVSPRIVHGGSIRVNGSAAFVAGDQVQLRVNQGLFDIIVDSGTGAATPIVHTGATGGPASTGAGDRHGIYMVAVPKNQLMTAILQGDVGFDPAVNAAIENGVVVLSAGFNTAVGQVDRYGDFGPVPKAGAGGTFEVRGGTVTSDLFGYAVTDMLASGGAAGGNLAFQQDVSLFAGARAHLFADAGQTVSVGGNIVVSAARLDTADPAAFDLTGGEAQIFAVMGGSVTIGGTASVDASGRGIVDQVISRAGNGAGGLAGIFADAGNVQIGGGATLLSTGQGGTIDFAPEQGGTGTGGPVLVEGRNGGTVQIAGALNVDASGTGSRAIGFAPVPTLGAPGLGGKVSLSATGGGSVTVSGATALTTNGTGGNVLNGPINLGGTGQGGTISILAGGALTLTGATTMSANGLGGSGPSGGAAIGGRITVDAAAGQIDFRGDANMAADATGGAGAFEFGGPGGSATGGDVLIRARSGAAASRVTGGAIAINARGTGGAGADGGGGTGGDGGDGLGGRIDLLAEAANGTVQFGAVTATVGGFGGGGGPGTPGGAGGDGTGGAIRVGTVAGPPAPAATGGATFAGATLNASGTGGTDGAGSARGNAAGGTISLLATGAPTQVTGLTTFTASALAGGGAVGFADGGTIIMAATAFGASGGTLTAGNVVGTASASGAPGTGNSPGEWHLTASGGSTINLANLSLIASVTGTPAIRPFSSLEPTGGVINVGQATLISLGDIRVIASGAGRITGGQLALAAGDNLTITHAAPVPGGLTIDVTDFSATARLAFSAGAGVVTRASNQTSIAAIGDATVAGQILGGNILLIAAALDVGATGAVGGAATNLTDIRVTGNVAVAGQVQGRNILITSAALGVGGTGVIGGAATDATDLRASGNATVAGQVLGRSITITAAAIDVGGTGVIGTAATDLADIRATGNATVAGQILGRNILLAANAIGVGATGVVGGGATERAELRALGNATVAGRVLGANIQIGSSDLDIAATGAVGDAGTQVATLALNATGQLATLGGTTQGPGYSLSQAEAGRLRAGRLRVLAPALGTGTTLLVRDLTLNGGGAAAGIGIFEVNTAGIARVEGALSMTGTAAGNGISLTARERIEVATPTGSVRVRDAAGMPAGSLLLASNNIWIASQAIIDQLRLNPNYAARDAELLGNNGIEEPRGYAESGAMVLATGGTLFVQNSGPPFSPAFGGVTVGAGGLTVQPTGAAPANVTAFGRRLNPDGSFTLAAPFFFEVNFQTGGGAGAPGAGYTLGSTFNTCIIVTRQCGGGGPAITPQGPDPITGPTGGSAAIQLPGAADEEDLVDTSFSNDPLIEEPVTSGGESSLWECDRDDDGDCDDQDD